MNATALCMIALLTLCAVAAPALAAPAATSTSANALSTKAPNCMDLAGKGSACSSIQGTNVQVSVVLKL